MNRPLLVTLLLLLALPTAVVAAKLYKWVDKNGKVTYQETSPPSGSGKVEEKNIDPDQNVIKADHPPPTPTPASTPSAGTSGQVAPNTGDRPRSTRPPAGTLLDNGSGTTQALPPPPPPPPVPPPAGAR